MNPDSSNSLLIEPIARFTSPFAEKFGVPRQSSLVQGLEGEIRFVEKFRRKEALKGIEGFDYLWLIWGFSKNAVQKNGDFQPTVRPPRLGGNATMGVFATRSPFRPNNLALSSVKVLSIDFQCPDGPVIRTSGADLCDGTPIYDIKPYIPYTDSHPDARSGFVDDSSWNTLEVVINPSGDKILEAVLTPQELETLKKVLSLDPRPHYQKNPEKTYGMNYRGMDIRFKVDGNILTVTECKKVSDSGLT